MFGAIAGGIASALAGGAPDASSGSDRASARTAKDGTRTRSGTRAEIGRASCRERVY